MNKIITGANMPNVPNASENSPSLQEEEQMRAMAKMIRAGTDLTCEDKECKGETFINVFKIKIVSGLITGTGKEMIIPVSVYACAKCGKVPAKFLDKFKNTEEVKDKK